MAAAAFFAKVYTSTGGTVRQTIDRTRLLSVPRIVRETGRPAGELTLDLAYPWDDFSYGTNINMFDLVKVYAVNAANPGGLLVYQGHITEIVAETSEGRDTVALRLHPIDGLLGHAHWKSGAGTTLADYTKSYTGADVDTIFSDIVTDANTVYGSFFSTSLGNPGLSLNVDFVELTHADALDRAAGLLDATWYWRINAAGQVKLAQWAATANHALTLGKDVDRIQVTKSLVDSVNGILLKWGPTPTRSFYNDATSESSYGKRQRIAEDADITNQTTADAFGNGEIARQKDPFTKIEITVNSNYAIETILPGDTVSVRNVTSGGSQMVTGVLKVVRVEYDGAFAVLSIADVAGNIGTEFTRAIA